MRLGPSEPAPLYVVYAGINLTGGIPLGLFRAKRARQAHTDCTILTRHITDRRTHICMQQRPRSPRHSFD